MHRLKQRDCVCRSGQQRETCRATTLVDLDATQTRARVPRAGQQRQKQLLAVPTGRYSWLVAM